MCAAHMRHLWIVNNNESVVKLVSMETLVACLAASFYFFGFAATERNVFTAVSCAKSFFLVYFSLSGSINRFALTQRFYDDNYLAVL